MSDVEYYIPKEILDANPRIGSSFLVKCYICGAKKWFAQYCRHHGRSGFYEHIYLPPEIIISNSGRKRIETILEND